jgi:hypothetical protein
MITINEIAGRLASLCEQHNFLQAYEELYSDHAVSIDPMNKNIPIEGLAALMERERLFLENTEIHAVAVADPTFAGDYFCVTMSLEFTPKGAERRKAEELCVYKVEYGKIVTQQFFVG